VYDVIVVGGGPAGLSAALTLGRCRRRTLLCDDGRPRNLASQQVNGFLTRDGVPPADLLRLARDQLRPYPVELREATVSDIGVDAGGFVVSLDDGAALACRLVLLATGLVDRLPALAGIEALYGRSVFHCQYCDGWEVRDQPLAAYGRGRRGVGLALSLKTWSDDVLLCTDGPARLRPDDQDRLARHGVPVYQQRIACLQGSDGMLQRIVFAGGQSVSRRAMFVHTEQRQRSELVARLGCRLTRDGCVKTSRLGETTVRGLYVAGDASWDVQLVVVAAAEGAKAAYAINCALEADEGREVRA
jgi:thioredoxin reductase